MSDAGCDLVVVVEDDPDVREAMVEVLEDEGYVVVGLSHGEQALRHLRAAAVRPQVILLDLMMPVMDGRGFREAQRRDPRLADIPVVVLTAHASAAEVALELGAAAFLPKPVELATLLETVARFCIRPEPSSGCKG